MLKHLTKTIIDNFVIYALLLSFSLYELFSYHLLLAVQDLGYNISTFDKIDPF